MCIRDRRAGLHRPRPAVRSLPGGRPVRLVPGGPAYPDDAAAQPDLDRHRPSGTRAPDGGAARRLRAGPRAGAHRRMERPGPAGPRAGIPCRRRPGRAGRYTRAVLRVARMNARAVEVPPAFGARASRGASWATWLEGLPRLVGDILAEWELEPDGATLHGECALVVPVRTAEALSLIHISEPTRQAEISYAVFC